MAALEQFQPYATAADEESERVDLGARIYRQVNERIRELSPLFDFGEPLPMFCECGSPACTARIAIDSCRFEEVRVLGTRFFVAPGHTGRDDSVVERTVEYWVVDVNPHTMREQEER